MVKRTPALSSTLNQAAEIPHISEDPTRRALQAKRGELGTRLDALNARQWKIEQRISLRVSNQGAAVQRLLENPLAEVDLADGLQEEYRKILSDREIVKKAVVALDAQILQQEAERDAWACAVLKPAHRMNVRATLNAQLALHRVVKQQEAIRDALTARGYSRTSHLVPHYHPHFLLGLGDPNTWLSGDLRTAREEGFVSEEERVGLMRGDIETLDATA